MRLRVPSPALDVHADGLDRGERWRRYFANHPRVIAAWGAANGGLPTCGCRRCDPRGILPTANVVAGPAG
ncbi:hypothetical protein [Pseudactinotalea sp. HY160]|uniref:hypothetical protein n=1 Tax=Pseudactinotalea sp. HY160 TaxID=2654490 RepID=UPI001883E5BA|nr:hypothetical protein [Pseudactinotalea sp. HY160]